MENRFGIKDFFLYVLISGLILTAVMAMWQFDRQYNEVLTIKKLVNDQTNDLNVIKRQIARGVVAAPSTGGGAVATTQKADLSDIYFKYMMEAEAKPGFARGDWLVDNFGTKIGKLTPFLATDVYQRYVEYNVMDSLVSRDPYTLEYVPYVAQRWEISPDGLTMRFFMRPEVIFSDGVPMTADDVVFTFDWVRNKEVDASRDRSYLTMLKDVKKIDTHTVEFTFTEPYFLNFSTVAGARIMAKHFYSKFTPAQFNEKVGLMFGSGPYKLEDPENWAPGKPVIIVRNERYWGVPPTFNRIIFREIQEESAQMVMYGNQETDNILCTPEVYKKLTADKRIMDFSNALEYPSPYRGYSYMGWNQKRKKDGKDQPTQFADKRVRQAMTMLIDRERMTREIFFGYAKVASGPFQPQNPQSDKSVQPWPYDPERAKALLAEAGFKDSNGDGVIEGPDGQPLKFTLLYPSGADLYEKLVRFIKDNLARGGVVMELDRQDWPVLVDRLNKSDFDVAILAWSTVPESDPYQIFHSSQIGDSGDNRTFYNSPELDKTIDAARRTMDTPARMKLWNRVHQILHEDQPYTFLVNRPYLRLINKRIKNVEKAGVGLNWEYLNGGTIPWFVPINEQRYTQ
ncbi:MAG: ABC transporter substrate-binding protein [Anaerolineae bacterium]|nr:ABC transporter substrate-binding protein [Phycisphaerae bacterium]